MTSPLCIAHWPSNDWSKPPQRADGLILGAMLQQLSDMDAYSFPKLGLASNADNRTT